MKKLLYLSVFISQILWAQTPVNTMAELDNPMLQTSIKLQPGFSMEPDVFTTYLDKQMKYVSKNNAYYKLERQFHSHNYVMQGVATRDDGYVVEANQQKLKNYMFVGYYPNGNPAFNFVTLYAPSVPNAYMLQGDAIWYREDGTLMAKGWFESGKLNGNYVEYDEFGEEVKKAVFNDGKVVNMNQFTSNENSIMVGDWVQDDGDVFLDMKNGNDLHNEYGADGTLKIYRCYYTLYDDQVKPDEVFCDDPVGNLNYKYIPKTPTQGIVEIYIDGKLSEKEAVTFINKNEYKSRTIYNINDTSTIGNTFHFKK